MSDMSAGQIVGGVIGAVVGTISNPGYGTVQGFAVGAGIGGMIDPPEGPLIKGPTLDNITFQSKIYGSEIPTIYGTVGINCPVMWLNNGQYKEVVVRTESGGKGGGGGQESEHSEYYATFAVSIGTASAGAQLRKVWIGGEVFVNLDSDDAGTVAQSRENLKSINFYDGTQTTADPLIEAEFGIDASPSYRGEMYMVIDSLSLIERGNTLASAPIKVEVAESTEVDPLIATSDTMNFATSTTLFSSMPVTLDILNTTIFNPNWSNDYPPTSTYGRADVLFFGQGANTVVDVNEQTEIPPDGLNDTNTVYVRANRVPFYAESGLNIIAHPYSTYRSRLNTHVIASNDIAVQDQWVQIGGVKIPSLDVRAVAIDENGRVLVLNASDVLIYTAEGIFVKSFAHNFGSFSVARMGTTFISADGGDIAIVNAWAQPNVCKLYDAETGAEKADFTLPSTSNYNSNLHKGIEIRSGLLIRSYAISATRGIVEKWIISRLGAGSKDIGEIINAIAARVGMPAIDVTDISGEEVDGYKTGSDSARGAIGPLQAHSFFDIISDGYQLKAVSRIGKSPIEVIDESDLAASAGDEREAIRLKSSFEMEQQLPYKKTITYSDRTRDYDQGSQEADYPTSSRQESATELPIVMTADKAKAIAETSLNLTHLERQTFQFSLPQTYLHLKESDIVTINTGSRSYDIRITDKTETADQIIDCRGKLSRSSSYVPAAFGAGAIFPPSLISPLFSSQTLLLDTPMVVDLQDNFSYVVAGYGVGNWSGEHVYRSKDSGQTYTMVKTVDTKASAGTSNGAFNATQTHKIDRVGSINITSMTGDFYSLSEEQMMNGSNLCAYGAHGRWEILQYTDATLEADDTFTLTGLLRGLRGTELASVAHEAGDQFVLLDSTPLSITTDVLDFMIPRKFKGVTRGLNLNDEPHFEFTYTGENLRPRSPVNADGYMSGSDMIITAQDRTRFQTSVWVSGVPAANEPTLQYEIDILSGDGGEVLRTLETGDLMGGATYTEAEQIADFGTAVVDVFATFYQISAVVGRGTPLDAWVIAQGSGILSFNNPDLFLAWSMTTLGALPDLSPHGRDGSSSSVTLSGGGIEYSGAVFSSSSLDQNLIDSELGQKQAAAFRLSTTDTEGAIIDTSDGNGSRNGWLLRIVGGNLVYLHVTSSGSSFSISTPMLWNDGLDHDYVVNTSKVSGNTVEVFIDGLLVMSGVSDKGWTFSGTTPLMFTSSNDRFWGGVSGIAKGKLRYFNKNLSSNEVLELHNEA